MLDGHCGTEQKQQSRVKNTLIEATIGLWQAESLSPNFFNYIIDEIIKSVKHVKTAYNMKNNAIQILCYADDAKIIAESEDFQRLLSRLASTVSFNNIQYTYIH